MEEASKLRSIRCPKCGNTLPDLPNFSVFQCGGCRAVLQAKNKEIADDGFYEVSEEGERRGTNEKGDINVSYENVIRNEMENDDKYGSREEERSQNEKSVSNGQFERKRIAHSVRTRQGGEMIGPRFNQNRRTAFHDSIDYRRSLRNSIDDPAIWNQGNVNLSRVEQKFAKSSLEDEMEGIRPPARSWRTMSAINDLRMERNESVSSWRNGANVMQQGRFFKPLHSDEGPSSYEMSSYHGYAGQRRYPEGRDGFARVAHMENDRVELLRKLVELKEQISKSGEVAYRPGKRISAGRRPPTPHDTYDRHDGYMSEGSPFHLEKQSLHSDEHFPVPPNLARGHGHTPSIHRSDINSNDSYSPSYLANSLAGYGDAYHKQMSRRPRYQQSSRQYSQQGYVDRFPDGRMPFNRDHLMLRPHETTFHHPSCSCSQCLNNNWYGPGENPTNMPSILRSRNDPTSVAPYHHMNSTAMGPTAYRSDGSHPYDQLQFTRPQSPMDSENSRFHQQWPRKMIVSKGGTRVNRPMAGGAPFITCLHCSVLLNIPVKVLRGTNQGKVKCGACSSIFVLECGPKGIVLSVSAENKNALEGISCFSDEVPTDILQSVHDKLKHISKIPSGGGQDHPDSVPKQSLEERRPISGESKKRRLHHISNSSLPEHKESSDEVPTDILQSVHDKLKHISKIPSGGGQDHPDSVPKQSLEERRPISGESEKRRLHHISNSSLPEHKESSDSVIIRENVSHPTKPSLEHDVLPRLEHSPQKAHPGPLHYDDSTSLYGELNKRESMGNENALVEQIITRHGSPKEAPVESEMDISVNDYTNSGMSQDSTELSKEDSKSRINNFTGLMKKSQKDLTKSGHEIENEKSNIFINGHMISERLLKKAKKVAGPIQPGQYWYDYRAGFWGVMGHPCLGVIPPKIEEFKFPIPEDCSNGNTKVFVNGRELHQEDLNLLSSRGLSITRHKYYLIEISGKVVDEQTGRELESLGNLAPTVERLGHGFGMTIQKSNAHGS